jgi:hypothetical protein
MEAREMIFRKVPLQRLEHKQQRRDSGAAKAGAETSATAVLDERQRVPAFHMRGLFAVIPTSDVSPLALRLSDVPREWLDSNAA